MLEQMVASHNFLVQVFVVFLIGGLLIPMMTVKKPLIFRKASFIYTMIFQAIATMIAFSGLVAMITGELGLTLSTIIMIVIWAALMYIEIKKYKLIKVSKIENPETHKLLKGAFMKISAVQIFLVIVMVVLKVMEVKGAISIS